MTKRTAVTAAVVTTDRRATLNLTQHRPATHIRVAFRHPDGTPCNVVPVTTTFTNAETPEPGVFTIDPTTTDEFSIETVGVFLTPHQVFDGFVTTRFTVGRATFETRCELPSGVPGLPHRVRRTQW